MARVTIVDVARRAGVSVASTSRALNGLVASAETVQKVRAAAAELGYTADATARSLKLGRTQQLAYAVADIGNPVYVEMMRAIERVVAASDYRLVISSTGDAEATLELVRSLSRGFVDGMVLSPLRMTDELAGRDRGGAGAGRRPRPPARHRGRRHGEGGLARGMELVVSHLVGEGRRRLAFINGPVDTTPGQFRHDGFRRAVAACPNVSAIEITVADFTIAEGYRAAIELLGDSADEIDAVVAANDLIGIGVLHAADDLGLRVPEDIAITGVDDTELAQVSRPSLTSVDLGAAERGRVAAELLLARIAEPERPVHTVTVAPALRVRDSTVLRAARPVRLVSREEASA